MGLNLYLEKQLDRATQPLLNGAGMARGDRPHASSSSVRSHSHDVMTPERGMVIRSYLLAIVYCPHDFYCSQAP